MSQDAPQVVVPATNGVPGGARSVSLGVLAVLAGIFVLRWASAVFVPILLGLMLSYALSPVVTRLQRWRIPRPVGAAVLLIIIVAGSGQLIYALMDDATALLRALPEAAQKLRLSLRTPGQGLSGIDHVQQAASELERAADESGALDAPSPRGGVTRVVIERPRFNIKDYLWSGTIGLIAFIGQTAMVCLIAYFVLASGDSFRRKLVRLAGPGLTQKRVTLDALDEINGQIQRYLLVQLFTSAIVGVATWLVFAWIGLDHAAVWGVAAGITNLIPYVGATLIGVGATLVGLMQFGRLETALLAGGASILIHAIVANLILPWMTSRAGRMNAVTVFITVLAWGWLWGLPGLLLGVPIMMVVKAICDRVESLKPIGELMGT